MFQALWLASFMFVLSLGRRVSSLLLPNRKRGLLISEYLLLYGALLAELIYDVWHITNHLPKLAWLDPQVLEHRFVHDLKNANMSAVERDDILKTTSLKSFPALRWLSLFTPIPVFFTWLICVWGTSRQARIIWLTEDADIATSVHLRDLVVQIIALPIVYSLMAFAAVMRMWQIVGDQWGNTIKTFSFQGREHYVFRVYEADYQVADLYEAWALYHFGTLVMSVLQRRFDSISAHRVFGAGAQIRIGQDVGWREVDIEKERREQEDSLHESVQKLTMQGVLSFVACCTVQSLYGLALPVLQEYFEHLDPKLWDALENSEIRAHDFFLGMGTVASTAAITNIIRVERIFHHQLAQFRPFWKFWGTKVLVSIAFLQMIVFRLPVPPFRYMSQVHTSLMYSAMLCYECFGVALLHLYAWNAHESWYGDAAMLPHTQEEQNPLARDYDVQPSTLGRSQDEGDDGLSFAMYDYEPEPPRLEAKHLAATAGAEAAVADASTKRFYETT